MDYKLRSDSLSEFAPAFIKAQGEFSTVAKNRKGRFDYADIDALLSMALPIVTKHGFFISHATMYDKDAQKTLLHTTITHYSDQWIKSIAPLDMAQDSREIQQEFGKAKSYQARYAIKDLLCISVTDDQNDDDGDYQQQAPDTISDKQVALLRARTFGNEKLREAIFKKYNVTAFDHIKKRDVNDIIKVIDALNNKTESRNN